ncbi:class E sortase [Amycolatopsis orientalis]|uniref:class E sortase n=1 Tax=Amycolatopsis orientalis TaxID=31958 RepID=UPI001376A8C8
MIWRVIGFTGELLAILGLVLGGFLAYQKWGKLREVEDTQVSLGQQLSESWQQEPPAGERTVPEGSPLTHLSIPRLGLRWTVVEGTDQRSLRAAPGHYRGSQLPGALGNFAVAAHRSPGLFWDLDKVQPGDEILIEDKSARYVYLAERTSITSPGDSAVLAAVPGEPGAAPSAAQVTLTTCNPKWDNYERLIVVGRLHSTAPKTPSSTAGAPGGTS